MKLFECDLNFFVAFKVFLSRDYLNNRVFLSINYRLILAPRKFYVVKTKKYFPDNMLVLRTNIKFLRDNYQTDSFET